MWVELAAAAALGGLCALWVTLRGPDAEGCTDGGCGGCASRGGGTACGGGEDRAYHPADVDHRAAVPRADAARDRRGRPARG